MDKKISLRFQQDFPYIIVFSVVLDSKSADTNAETLCTEQKCRIKNINIWSPPKVLYIMIVAGDRVSIGAPIHCLHWRPSEDF